MGTLKFKTKVKARVVSSMKIIRNTSPITDIYNQMKSGELLINRKYQRSPGLWPNNARSYFIDTILNDFPFPKVVFRQKVDIKTRKTSREIIDGQQRLTAIRDFINDKFKLSSVSKRFNGHYFSELDEDIQQDFLSYEVSIDMILTASNEEVLEVFRRINSYTLPLNTAEKRHATYQGEFKWFVHDLTEYITPFLEEKKVLSVRDVSRMMDSDLITECCQLVLSGVQNRSSPKLDNIYKEYDSTFSEKDKLYDVIKMTFDVIKDRLTPVFDECKVTSYMFYSLFGALAYNKFGFRDEELNREYHSSGHFFENENLVIETLIRDITDASEKVENESNAEFVNASLTTTHSLKNRLARIKHILRVLQRA